MKEDSAPYGTTEVDFDPDSDLDPDEIKSPVPGATALRKLWFSIWTRVLLACRGSEGLWWRGFLFQSLSYVFVGDALLDEPLLAADSGRMQLPLLDVAQDGAPVYARCRCDLSDRS